MTDPAAILAGAPVRPLIDAWRLLLRRRVLIAAVTIAVLTGVAVKTFQTTPSYRAVTIVQIERADPNIMKFQDLMTIDPSSVSYQDFYQTQYRLIESRTVAEKAVRELGLADDAVFLPRSAPGPLSRLWSALARRSTRQPTSRPGAPPASDDSASIYADAVLAGLRVEPVKNSHLVSVAFVSRSPEMAAKVANGVAEAYIDFGMETRMDTGVGAQSFLAQQIGALRGEVETLERQAQQYGESKEIIPTSGEGNTTVSALEDLQRAFTAAQANRAEKEAAYEAVRTAPDSAVPQVLSSRLIQDLTAEVASLERDQAELGRKFKPGWPALAVVSTKLEQARGRLAQETAALASGAREEAQTAFRSAALHEGNLSHLFEMQKRTAIKLSTDAIEYTNLRSEIAKKRETLDQLLKRQSELSFSTHLRDTRQSNIRVVDRARVPTSVYRPNIQLNLLMGLLAGLGLAIGLVFVLDNLDSTIKSAEEIRSLAGLPVLGVIPRLRPAGPRPVRRGARAENPEAGADLITHLDPRSMLAEAYKDLRTATLLASPDQPPRAILVTSCLPQEGKSQTALNLAIAFAQAGRRVLIVDTDLRRPRLDQALGLESGRGVSNYLSGNATLDPLVQPTAIPGLWALPSGPIPPNPSELLASRNFLALVQEFSDPTRFDHVIFDSPPILSVADPIVIAPVLDGTVLVVEAGGTTREALQRGATKLRQGNIKVLGVVLNSVSASDRGAYYTPHYAPETKAERGAPHDRRADRSA